MNVEIRIEFYASQLGLDRCSDSVRLCDGTSLLHTVRRLFLARQDGLLDWGKLLVHVRSSVCCVTLGAHSVSLCTKCVCACV